MLTSERHLTPTAEYEPGGEPVILAAQQFLLDKITLDDGRTNQNPNPAIHPNGSVFLILAICSAGVTWVQNVTGVWIVDLTCIASSPRKVRITFLPTRAHRNRVK